MTKDTTRHLFLVFAISVGLLLPLSFAPLNADEVKYCFRSGPAKSILAQYDDEVRLLSQQQLIDAEKTHLPYGFPTMCPLRLFNPYYINCYDTRRERSGSNDRAGRDEDLACGRSYTCGATVTSTRCGGTSLRRS